MFVVTQRRCFAIGAVSRRALAVLAWPTARARAASLKLSLRSTRCAGLILSIALGLASPAQAVLHFSTLHDDLEVWFSSADVHRLGCGFSCDPSSPRDWTTLSLQSRYVGVGHSYQGPGPCTYCGCCSEASGLFTGVVRVMLFVDPVTGQPKPRYAGGVPADLERLAGATMSFYPTGGASECAYPATWCQGTCFTSAAVSFGDLSLATMNNDAVNWIGTNVPLSGNGAAFLGYLRYFGNNCSGQAGVGLSLNVPIEVAVPAAALFPPSPPSALTESALTTSTVLRVVNRGGENWTDLKLKLINPAGAVTDSLDWPSLSAGKAINWAVPSVSSNGAYQFQAEIPGGAVVAVPNNMNMNSAPQISRPYVLLKMPDGSPRSVNLARTDASGLWNHCSCGSVSVSLDSEAPAGTWVEMAPESLNVSDEFENASLRAQWQIENPSAPNSRISTTERPGFLRVVASAAAPGSDYYNGSNFRMPRVFQSVAGDWELVSRLEYSPGGNYSGAGLFLNGFRVAERGFYPGGGGQVARCLGGYVPWNNSTVYFRVTKQDSLLTGYLSSDGTNWIANGTWTARVSCAGVFAVRQNWDGNGSDYPADFDYVRITPLAVTDVPEPGHRPVQLQMAISPNPASDQAVARYTLPIDSYVEVKIRDVAGRVVFTRTVGMQRAGTHEFRWDGPENAGPSAKPGIYFLTTRAGTLAATRKFVVAR